MRLRTRILVGFGVVLAIVVAVGATVVTTQRQQLIEQLDRRLDAVVPLDRPQQRADDAGPPLDVGGEREQPISDLYLAEILDDGSVLVVVQGQLLSSVPDLSGVVDTLPIERTTTTLPAESGDGGFRVLLDTAAGRDGTLVVAIPIDDVDETVDRLTITFVIVAVLVAAVLALLAAWVVRLGLRPVAAVAETARAVAGGERSRRAPTLDDRTEAGELAVAFNLMLDQRDEAEDRLRRFASDASHELRTPLTSIRGYLDLYVAGAFREDGQLDDVVRRMQGEAGRMQALVEELLELARFDEGRSIEVATTDLGRLVADVAANAAAAHPDRSIAAPSPSSDGVVVRADAARITQVVTLLVDNALTHAPEASVELVVESTDGGALVAVVDDGPGMTEDDAARVFTRFFRGDASRARSSGGSGLGLSIAAAIVEAHQGELRLLTEPGAGCRFEIELPADPSVGGQSFDG